MYYVFRARVGIGTLSLGGTILFFIYMIQGSLSYRFFGVRNVIQRLIALAPLSPKWVISRVQQAHNTFNDFIHYEKQTPKPENEGSSDTTLSTGNTGDEPIQETITNQEILIKGNQPGNESSNLATPSANISETMIDEILSLAEMYKEKGQFLLYEKKLIEGMVLDGSNTRIIKKLAEYYFHSNNHKKSISLLKKVIEMDPIDHEALRQLGDIYLEQGDFPQAELLIQKSINLASDRPKYYISMVEIAYNTGRIDESIDLMQKAVHLRPSNVSYLMAIAGLYEEIDDKVRAKKYYFHVLESEPTNSQARRKLNSI